MFDFLKNEIGMLASVATVIALFWTLFQYIKIRKEESSREQFQRYHELIRRINYDPKETDKRPYLEVQIASVYELTNLPKYYEVSLRLLQRRAGKTHSRDLREEIIRAITAIERRKCRWRRQ